MVRGGGEGLSDPTAITPEDADLPEAAGPERRCIATGAVRPKAELIRFVAGPDGQVVPDLAERLPGRGLWVSAEREAMLRAQAKGLFAKAARRPVRAPDDLVDRVEALLHKSCIDLIGMARRAGQAVAGYEKVHAWLAEGRAAVLLAASDGAADGRAKLAALAAAVRPAPALVEIFSADALGMAFARDRMVHAAIARGGLAERLVAEAARLDGIRGRADRVGPAGRGVVDGASGAAPAFSVQG
ncbi:RNA-binding protein [Inquilinus sp. Marseille-Q2685]|uniref:RNA-binding protein n=1 Tax=Inquilinus sp. Marseille-Q2685 TaxID=2866581 RepID=UPI001CE495B1|nr:RNA-binding protein [Inquilinus sp. Marseille-Q2685]